MGTQARTQSGHSVMAGSLSSLVGPLVIAAALLVGAAGGYALRGAGAELRGAQGATSTETAGSMVVPRSVREGESTASLPFVPRSVREGIEITPFQAPAPRWTHEDDQPFGK